MPAAVLLGGWAFVAAVSDASVFTLPTATELAERWFADSAEPARFELATPKDWPKQNYPRMFGIDLEDYLSSAQTERAREAAAMIPVVASFDLETRIPAPNLIRNRPHRIRWADRQGRDVELFPPPRRVAGSRKEMVFPGNLVLSRSTALIALAPEQTVVRRIRRGPGADSWLLYARYPARSAGRDKARLRLERRGRWRSLWVEKGKDILVDLDLRHTDVLYNGVFSTVRLKSNEPVFVWLVSPQERGWFLLMMERWRDLEAWERQRPGWKSEARLAVAKRHLGVAAVDPEGVAAVEAALPGFRTGDPAKLFRVWTRGVDLGLYADPRPRVAMERYVAKGAAADHPPPDLPPGGRLAGPFEHLVPGFYRVTWVVSGSGWRRGAGLPGDRRRGAEGGGRSDHAAARGPAGGVGAAAHHGCIAGVGSGVSRRQQGKRPGAVRRGARG